MVSGLAGERYQFVGYLPRRVGELRELARALARWEWSVVAFESPRRLSGSLAALAEEMPERPAAVCRELTKMFEEVARGTLSELCERFAEPPKGEVTIVLGATPVAAQRAEGLDEALAAVAELVANGVPRRTAADLVARLTGTARNALYRGSL